MLLIKMSDCGDKFKAIIELKKIYKVVILFKAQEEKTFKSKTISSPIAFYPFFFHKSMNEEMKSLFLLIFTKINII